MYSYITHGTCSRQIDVELEGDVVRNVVFHGGCNGNLQGISNIVRGKTIDEVSAAFEGIKCGFKSTSCPDQLVQALREARAEQEKEQA